MTAPLPTSASRPADEGSFCPRIYARLHRIARWHLARERSGHAFETADLVHEVYIRLAEPGRVRWADHPQLYALASRAMRQILIDHARRHRAAKRGGGWRQVELASDTASLQEPTETRVALAAALERLARVDARLWRVVECRFFGELSGAQMADALGVTDRTCRRDWCKARAWLHRELAG